jgi:HlyD family secretion protein
MSDQVQAAAAPRSDYDRALRGLGLAGAAVTLLFGGTVGLWAMTATWSGAVVASGQFVVDGNVKKVQHASGGIVGDLKVRDGAHVEEGDLLIRLDDTLLRANLQIVVKQLDQLAARAARLEAERDRRDGIAVPPDLAARQDEPEIAGLVAGEQAHFFARQAVRSGQKEQLQQRLRQLQDEIDGLKAQQASRDRQAVLIAAELVGVRDLYKANLVPITRLNALEREAAALDGQKGQLIASIAQAEGKIAETRLQIIQIDADLAAEVMRELREIQGKTAELTERRVAAEDQLKRVDIRAPSSGFVHQLAVHTIGGVLPATEPAMLIVPVGEALQLEARVLPQDVDQVAIGQEARVRVHAFNQRTTPELRGTVSRISADVSRDQQSGATYYTIRVAVPAEELAHLGPVKLIAGMQAEVFVRTGDRTPLEFIAKPLKDQFERAFRER